MSRLFCIDGTNLVRSAFGYGGPAHAAQEEADTDRMAVIFGQFCEDGDGSVEVELFFDGAFRTLGGPRPDTFRISFTRELPADQLMLDRVRSRKWNGQKTVVVTADVELGEMAEAEGGKWLRIGHGAGIEGIVRRMRGRI